MSLPSDYLDPTWDDAGDPASWKFYVSDLDMVTWLEKPVEERERLAIEAQHALKLTSHPR